MITLQNPSLPISQNAIEIDKAIIDVQSFLTSEIDWLTNGYGRAYKHIDITKGNRLYFPSVYLGEQNNSTRYTNISPDNDKKGQCFFLVKREDIGQFSKGNYSYLSYEVSIIFSVNLELINKPLLDTDYFLQNCIAEVRDVLTRRYFPTFFTLSLSSVDLLFSDVFSDFDIEKQQQVEKSPLGHFKINCTLEMYEDCISYDPDPSIPTDGLILQLDPAIGVNSGNPSEGESIFLIEDQSGEINNFGQLTGSLQPTWVSSGINNLPSIDFDTASLLTNNGMAFSSDSVSFFIVFKRNGTAHGGYSCPAILSTPTVLGEFLQLNDLGGFFNFNAFNNSLDQVLATASNNTFIIGIVKDSTGIEFFVNGASIGTKTGTQNITGTTHHLGAFVPNYFNGLMGEVIIYDREINSSEVLQVNNYLINKWL